ncbi:MAG: hypothetical protein PHW96_04040 [Candidatus Nanoarchaeia archaeon]|nr:hypothetical protein [Candidatus Nanoarchaeia archaeon]
MTEKKLELSKKDVELVQEILKELKKESSIEQKIVFLENAVKKAQNKELKAELQKLVRVMQNRIMHETKNIEAILNSSRIPATHDLDVPIIREIEARTPLEDDIGFTMSMGFGSDKKAYSPAVDYLSKKTDSTESNELLSYKVSQNANDYMQSEDKNNDYVHLSEFEKPKTDKEPEPYINKIEKDKKKEKKFGQVWED